MKAEKGEKIVVLKEKKAGDGEKGDKKIDLKKKKKIKM